MFNTRKNTCTMVLRLTVCFYLIAVGQLVGQSKSTNELRAWRDIEGGELKARLVRYRDGIVYLRDLRRNTVKIAPSFLSQPDQKYIVNLLREQKQDELADEFEKLANARNTGTSSNTDRLGVAGGVQNNTGNASGNKPGPEAFKGRPRLDSPFDIGETGAPPPRNKPRKPGPGQVKTEKREIDTRDPNFDPFADLRPAANGPANSTSNDLDPDTSNFGKPVPIESDNSSGYQPPTIDNKRDDSKSLPANNESTKTESTPGTSNQSIILIALGVIGVLFLIMIALLIMVLVKAKAPQPRRHFF